MGLLVFVVICRKPRRGLGPPPGLIEIFERGDSLKLIFKGVLIHLRRNYEEISLIICTREFLRHHAPKTVVLAYTSKTTI